ncbi:hypothetical protein BDR06DRAFT_873023 [Suillus hirtellus]|nr:hypothetical protein BDR06DRAFT_873023 [Suillus hirtellus]
MPQGLVLIDSILKLFIFLKGDHSSISTTPPANNLTSTIVLHVSQSFGFWYQKALLTSKLQEIFVHVPPAPNSVINQCVCDATTTTPSKESEPVKKHCVPGPEDNCPICYKSMHGTDRDILIWCETCVNAVHKECFTQWTKSCGRNITCVFCFNVSTGGQASKEGKASILEGYINLGTIVGLSQECNISSYYHGSRCGYRHYCYQTYFRQRTLSFMHIRDLVP